MEYLVTMTTHVPEGTSEAEVEDVKAREATHSRELATERHLLRLWRPPPLPGLWRTFGLFDAADQAELESVLRSMPLRIWRTDDIVPLRLHPNDPGRTAVRSGTPAPHEGGHEFFTAFTVAVPPGTPGHVVDEANAEEATRTRELAGLGLLQRLWKLPASGRALGLWWAPDAGAMQEILGSLPWRDWFTVETVQLGVHPSDPPLTDG
jgi:muconolactone delta-isomerase